MPAVILNGALKHRTRKHRSNHPEHRFCDFWWLVEQPIQSDVCMLPHSLPVTVSKIPIQIRYVLGMKPCNRWSSDRRAYSRFPTRPLVVSAHYYKLIEEMIGNVVTVVYMENIPRAMTGIRRIRLRATAIVENSRNEKWKSMRITYSKYTIYSVFSEEKQNIKRFDTSSSEFKLNFVL